MKLQIEYQTGKVEINKTNVLVKDLTDMHEIEYWEERLTKLKQPYLVAFRKRKNKVLYSIYTDLKGKGSVFKILESET